MRVAVVAVESNELAGGIRAAARRTPATARATRTCPCDCVRSMTSATTSNPLSLGEAKAAAAKCVPLQTPVLARRSMSTRSRVVASTNVASSPTGDHPDAYSNPATPGPQAGSTHDTAPAHDRPARAGRAQYEVHSDGRFRLRRRRFVPEAFDNLHHRDAPAVLDESTNLDVFDGRWQFDDC